MLILLCAALALNHHAAPAHWTTVNGEYILVVGAAKIYPERIHGNDIWLNDGLRLRSADPNGVTLDLVSSDKTLGRLDLAAAFKEWETDPKKWGSQSNLDWIKKGADGIGTYPELRQVEPEGPGTWLGVVSIKVGLEGARIDDVVCQVLVRLHESPLSVEWLDYLSPLWTSGEIVDDSRIGMAQNGMFVMTAKGIAPFDKAGHIGKTVAPLPEYVLRPESVVMGRYWIVGNNRGPDKTWVLQVFDTFKKKWFKVFSLSDTGQTSYAQVSSDSPFVVVGRTAIHLPDGNQSSLPSRPIAIAGDYAIWASQIRTQVNSRQFTIEPGYEIYSMKTRRVVQSIPNPIPTPSP